MTTFEVTPSSFGTIPSDLDREVEEEIIQYLLNLYREGYKTTKIVFKILDRKHVVVESRDGKPNTQLKRDENKVAYENLRSFLMKHYLHKWVIIRDGSLPRPGVFYTRSDAVQHADEDDYVACVGAEDLAILFDPQILLQSWEIPTQNDMFIDLEKEAYNKETYCPPRGFYFTNQRRWFVLSVASLRNPSKKKPFFFLMDTGSPITSINNTTRKALALDDPISSVKEFSLCVDQVKVIARASETLSNSAAHNINLLGTDFLDRYLITDNASIQALKLNFTDVTMGLPEQQSSPSHSGKYEVADEESSQVEHLRLIVSQHFNSMLRSLVELYKVQPKQ